MNGSEPAETTGRALRVPFRLRACTHVPRPDRLSLLVIAVFALVVGGFELVKAAVPSPVDAPAPSLCLLKNTTGVPCPTCGSTRAVKAVSRGAIGEAFGHNPLVFSFGLGLGAALALRLVTGHVLQPAFSIVGWISIAAVLLSAFLLNWWWVLRADGIFVWP